MQINLLKAIRSVKLVDSHKDRQDFFEHYLNQHKLAKLIISIQLIIKGSFVSGFLYFCFSSRYLLKKPYLKSKKYNLLASVDYINERRSISDFLSLVEDNLTSSSMIEQTKLLLTVIWNGIRNFGDFLRIIKFLVKFEKTGSFLTCCRIAELLFLYNLSLIVLRNSRFKGIIIASNYTPCACALKAAADKNLIPSIYTFHAIITPSVKIPPLEVDMACLYGERALDVLKKNGGVNCKQIVYSGLSGISLQLKVKDSFEQVKSVGVFLTSHIIDSSFSKLLQFLSEHKNIKEIIVRPHPLKEANPDLTILNNFSKVKLDSEGRVIASAQKCDFVIAGSSGVHVDVLKAGIPTLYWEDFDTIGPDYYGLIRDNVVLELKNLNQIDWHSIKDFYSQDWISRFQKFDYSYLKDNAEIVQNLKFSLEQTINKL